MTHSVDGYPRVTLHIPETAPVGSAIPITIRIENETAAPIDLYLRGRDIAFDVLVTGSGGEIVWRRLEGEVVQAILRLEVLLPGQAIEVRDSWDQRTKSGETVAPGIYAVVGKVLSDGSSTLESAAVAVRIGQK